MIEIQLFLIVFILHYKINPVAYFLYNLFCYMNIWRKVETVCIQNIHCS